MAGVRVRERAERITSKKRPPTEEERIQRDRFKQAVLIADRAICVVHGEDEDCDGELQAHHVVTQQQLRHALRHDLLWHWRNGVTVCETAHRRHTLAVERIPYELLPARCILWADEHGFAHILDRFYTRPT